MADNGLGKVNIKEIKEQKAGKAKVVEYGGSPLTPPKK